MQNSQLQRLLHLMRQTGDKSIVLDNETEQMFVMMNVDDYENLIGVTDFDTPFAPAGETVSDVPDFVIDDAVTPAEGATTLDTSGIFAENGSTLDDEKTSTTIEKMPTISQKNTSDWNIHNRANPVLSEETLTDVPHEEEEERFYLEPVE